ncbi:type II secretion system F family protein [Streptomyces monticola]|uniref:Type II secretion system F family protein n=1 Tax=Streptomyces monticola TaxID=2666263 RepID=A0ABW2JLP3_9ACTN
MALAYGMFPPRPALAQVFAHIQQPPMPTKAQAASTDDLGWAQRAGHRCVPLLRAAGLPGVATAADLRVVDKSVDRHLAEKATAGTVGACMPWAAGILWYAAVGAWPDWWMPTSGGLLLGIALFFAPDLDVRRRADQRREELRHVLSVFLSLTVIALAGGAGVQQALNDASQESEGWSAGRIRAALSAAELTRTGVWEHLRELGEETGVGELGELAAAVSLAGSEGAKVRASLAAKARAMRRRQLAQADGAARAATERMSLPVVVLFSGFLVFLGYPALAQVLEAT